MVKKLKETLSNTPMLIYPHIDKTFALHIDAISGGLVSRIKNGKMMLF